MTYSIEYSAEAAKQLQKLDKKIAEQIFRKIHELKEKPLLGKPLRNNFKNYRSLHTGKHQAIYFIKGKIIIIAKIKHRKSAYG